MKARPVDPHRPYQPLDRETHTVNGIRLSLLTRRARGDTPVVLLHGFPGHAGTWRRVLDLLPADHSCFAADLRGFGDSSRPPRAADYHVAHGVADIATLIRHLSPDHPAVIVGHDIGGLLGYVLAARHPGLVRGLVVLNGVHPAAFRQALMADRSQIMASDYMDALCHPDAAQRLSAHGYAPLSGIYRHMLAGTPPLPGEEVDLIAAWSEDGRLDAMLNWYRANRFYRTDPEAILPMADLVDLPDARMRIRVPHLLIWGTPDPYLHPVNHQLVEPLCDRLDKLLLPGAGHAPQLTRADTVARAIGTFISDLPNGHP